jgi:hypothetical protein
MDETSKKKVKSRAAYLRRWRKEHPDKHLAIQKRYIEKKIKQLGNDDNDQN